MRTTIESELLDGRRVVDVLVDARRALRSVDPARIAEEVADQRAQLREAGLVEHADRLGSRLLRQGIDAAQDLAHELARARSLLAHLLERRDRARAQRLALEELLKLHAPHEQLDVRGGAVPPDWLGEPHGDGG